MIIWSIVEFYLEMYLDHLIWKLSIVYICLRIHIEPTIVISMVLVFVDFCQVSLHIGTLFIFLMR